MDICVMYCSEHLGSTFFVIHHSLIYFFFFKFESNFGVGFDSTGKVEWWMWLLCGVLLMYLVQPVAVWVALFYNHSKWGCISLVRYFCVQMWLDWDRFSGGCLDVDVLCQCLHQMAVCWVDFQPRVQTKRFKWVNLFLSDSLKSVQKC